MALNRDPHWLQLCLCAILRWCNWKRHDPQVNENVTICRLHRRPHNEPSQTGNTLQHTATHFNTLQHTATHCNTKHCNTLQHTTLQHMWPSAGLHSRHPQNPCSGRTCVAITATHCNTLQHTATQHSLWQPRSFPRKMANFLEMSSRNFVI